MNRNPDHFPFPDQLPPEVALALFDCLAGLIDAVWQHYESVLLDQIIHDLHARPVDDVVTDLDDDIPF